MKSVLAGVVLASCGLAWAADPVVKDVTFAQDEKTRIVAAQYTLENGPASVTAEIVAGGTNVSQAMKAVYGGALSTTDGVEARSTASSKAGRIPSNGGSMTMPRGLKVRRQRSRFGRGVRRQRPNTC